MHVGTLAPLDAIIVGSGPGGATVARDLARAGKRVALLEYGKDHRGKWYYGTPLGAMLYAKRGGLMFSKEGMSIIQPMLTGGATNMFAGCAARPPDWWTQATGVDIERELNHTIEELNLAPLPERDMGVVSLRMMESARSLGYDWQPQMKFIDSSSCRLDCGAKCMYGCGCGGKWTANEYIDEAVAAGATLITQANVREVIVEDGVATGVRGKIRNQPFEMKAKTVIVAAGGLGSCQILQRSGMREAGDKISMDTTFVIYGVAKERGNYCEPPMTVSYTDDEQGYMLATLTDPAALFPMMMALKGPTHVFKALKYRRLFGIMCKVKDELSGYIGPEGEISKPVTDADFAKAKHGFSVSREILVKSGCDPDSVFWTIPRGTHPCATVRIGEHLDTDLKTQQFDNLYVCDSSTFPGALDRPPTLTIIALGKRLAQHLTATVLSDGSTN